MKKLSAAVVLISMMFLQGCGAIMSMRGAAFETQITNTNPNTLASPVKSDIFVQVQSVAIADLSDGLTEYPSDNVVMYKAMLQELRVLLEESGQFRVVGPDEFRAKLRAVNGPLDPRVAPDYEIDAVFQKVGKALGVHGIVSMGLEEKGQTESISNQIRYMGQIIKDGGLTIDLEGTLKLIRSRELETLYEQKSDVAWASGTGGLESTSAAALRKMMRDLLKPMVDQMVEKHRG
ncbi:MAG: hypothetical protein ACQEV6_07725 [Pseudomonadota bacterium]